MSTRRIPVEADTSHLDHTLRRVRGDIQNIQDEIDIKRRALTRYWQYASQVTQLMLTQFSENAVAQKIQAAQQVVLAGISIGRVALEAEAAFATGNIVQGVTLTTITGLLMNNLVKAQLAQRQAELNQANLERIKNLTNGWSP